MKYNILFLVLLLLLIKCKSVDKSTSICIDCLNSLYNYKVDSFYTCLNSESKIKLKYLENATILHNIPKTNRDSFYLRTSSEKARLNLPLYFERDDKFNIVFSRKQILKSSGNNKEKTIEILCHNNDTILVTLVKTNKYWKLELDSSGFINLLKQSKNASYGFLKYLVESKQFKYVNYYYKQIDVIPEYIKYRVIQNSIISENTDSSFIYLLVEKECYQPFSNLIIRYAEEQKYEEMILIDYDLSKLGMTSAMISIGDAFNPKRFSKYNKDLYFENKNCLDWYALAAKNGNGRGFARIAHIYDYGMPSLDIEINIDSVVYYYKKAVDLQDGYSAHELGIIFLNEHRYYNPDLALELMKNSFKWGYECAACDLGDIFLLHYEQPDSAKYWYEKGLNTNCFSSKKICKKGIELLKNWR